MTIYCESKGGNSRLSIESDLTIYSANDDKNQLFNHLFQSNELEIDLSKVSELDTSGCQLLMMLKREADGLGKAIRFTGHSQAVLDVWDAYDLAGYFGDPLVITKDEGGRMKDE